MLISLASGAVVVLAMWAFLAFDDERGGVNDNLTCWLRGPYNWLRNQWDGIFMMLTPVQIIDTPKTSAHSWSCPHISTQLKRWPDLTAYVAKNCGKCVKEDVTSTQRFQAVA